MNDSDMLVYGDGKTVEVGVLRQVLEQHTDVVWKMMLEAHRNKSVEDMEQVTCPTCGHRVLDGVQRWHGAKIGRMIWFEPFPDDPPLPFVDLGDVVYIRETDEPHYYTHDRCGEMLPVWIVARLDGLVEDHFWLPSEASLDEEEDM